MKHFVTPTQVEGWMHHKVLPVVRALKMADDEDLEQVLEEAVLGNKNLLWSNFLPIPFKKKSEEAKRLLAAWERVKLKYPNRVMVRDFVWKFWNPRTDTVNAMTMSSFCKTELIPANEGREQAVEAAMAA